MKHADDNNHERELFARLEADMTADSGADVVDLGKARSARNEPADPTADRSADHAPHGSAGESADSRPDASVSESDEDRLVMVDSPEPVGPGLMDRIRAAKRRDVVPAWARSKPEFLDALGWLAGHTGHSLAFHAVRLPLYAGTLAARAPVGVARFVGGSPRWVADAEGEPVRLAAVRREDAADYLKLSRQRDARVRMRGILFTLALIVGPAAALALYVLAPGWLLAIAVAATVAAFGFAGAPADRPVITRAVVNAEVEKLTSTIVERALGALGHAEINKALGKGGDGINVSRVMPNQERRAWQQPIPGRRRRDRCVIG